jgi:DNA polymerase III epsilon subunit-like protein
MKYKLLFLDTETTGNEDKDRLCQIAYSDGHKRVSALYKPPIPISIESMAVHHITEKMVAHKPAFEFSVEHKELHERLHDEETILVAHNAPFDIGMLKKEGIIPEKWIDTLRVARALDPEEKISSYRLQYLRYLLDLNVEGMAHDALGDVLVLEKLFDRLLKKMTDENGGDEDKAIEEMMKISQEPCVFKTFRFGKYNGEKVQDVANKDRGYLEWLLKSKMENNPEDEDWIHTLKHFLGK